MLFYEPLFLLFFFPAVYAAYLAFHDHKQAKQWTLLLASVAFYTWGEPLFIPVLLVSSLFDYWLSLRMAETTSETTRRTLVAAGIIGNVAVLGFYKYVDFAIANLNLLLTPLGGPTIPLLQIALPIGVSFVVFEKITYLVDTYRGTTTPAQRFRDYCLFVFFFPKLLAGPILKYHEMSTQIADPAAIKWVDFHEGFLRLARGIVKKVLIADTLGAFADRTFAADPAALDAGLAWLGLVCFTLQIYFDFSGYSDMAIGLARMLGFGLRENFNMPYIARSLTEFWRRWHISLTSWIREYLYLPLGGNRLSELRTYVNLWLCFLASGLWHGASWNFVLWGAYNGLFLTLDRLFLQRLLDRCGAFIATTVTLLVVMLGWVIFRSTSLDQIAGYMTALAGMQSGGTPIQVQNDVPAVAAIGTLLALLPATPLYGRLRRAYERYATLRALAAAVLVILFVIAVARTLSVPFMPFIYFRF
jgi:alginate O-acetyltransferase complex protein AlgI